MIGTVYLLHFERPLHHAQHYIGFTDDLEQRVKRHRDGRGARLVSAFSKVGIGFEVARTWPGDRAFERALKKRRNARFLCPVCRDVKARDKETANVRE